jgi:hypothetical protein
MNKKSTRSNSPGPISFADFPHTPGEHFKLYFFFAILQVIPAVLQSFNSPEDAFGKFPFLAGYNNEMAAYGLEGMEAQDAVMHWQAALESWEDAAREFLPIRALRWAAGLDHCALTLLFSIGLAEEDTRFGAMYEALHGIAGQRRPSLGLLNAFWQWMGGSEQVRPALHRLQEIGLVQVLNPDAPCLEWIYQVSSLLWDALRGETLSIPLQWAHYRPAGDLLPMEALILPLALQEKLVYLPALLASGEVQTLVVRGPQHNGRRTLLGAVAGQLGCGLLEVAAPSPAGEHGGPSGDDHWRLVGPLATLQKALPVILLDLAPGETVELPPLIGYQGPIGVAMGNSGGLRLPTGEAITLVLDLPAPQERRRHWQASLGEAVAPEDLDDLAEHFRMTGGNIRRAASLACSYAALAGHPRVEIDDVRQAGLALNRQTLEVLARRLPVSGDWSQLAVSANTMNELISLEARCRHRERLSAAVHPSLGRRLNAGVRALFSGPSGTGKTLAACLLASVLQRDIYRLDLSAVVNKYIGETEKNLGRVFDRAEELDVILLLDEGDALLTQRTSVQSANDRYANLETNYLLQRIESFEGILIVTTNAGERIDSAFQRRMDVLVDFHPPDAAERWNIWNLHLPAAHGVEASFLRDVAARCVLTGGQIRNATLHASLLALNNGGVITTTYLEEAVQREYRKSGAACPLRKRG